MVAAAFAAHLQNDEETLRALYDDNGEGVCDFAFSNLSRCIAAAYRVQGLNQVEEWWVEGDGSSAYLGTTFITVNSRWSGSDQIWQQVFTVIESDGDWLIHENWTQVYPSDG